MRFSYSGKKVLVTGAGGFIGSHLVERLIVEGAEVTAALKYNSSGSLGNLGFLKKMLDLKHGWFVQHRRPDTIDYSWNRYRVSFSGSDWHTVFV